MPSLKKSIPGWLEILPELGVRLKTNTLPADIKCLFCKQQTATIIEHPLSYGQWYTCTNCKKDGDIWQILAKKSGKSEEYWLNKFRLSWRDLGFENHFDYEEHVRYPQIAGSKILSALREIPVHRSPHAAELFLRWGLGIPENVDSTRDSLQQICGCIFAMDLAKQTPKALGVASKTADSANMLLRRLYLRTNNDLLLLLPMYAAPTILANFAVINPVVEPTVKLGMLGEHNFRLTNRMEAGLAMPPTFQPGPIVAVRDPWLYMFVQSLSLRRTGTFANIVCWYGDSRIETDTAWAMLRDHDIHLWDSKADNAMFRQAHKLQCNLLLHDSENYSRQNLSNKFGSAHALDFCDFVVQNSTDWARAIERRWKNLEDAQLNHVIDSLETDGLSLDVFQKFSHNLQSRLVDLPSRNEAFRTCVVNECRVEERAEGWVTLGESKPAVISGAVICLKNLVWFNSDSKGFFNGYVRVGDRKVSFEVPYEEFENNTYRWLSRFCLSNNLGVLSVPARWKRELFTIANKMSKVVVQHGYDELGWDRKTNSFIFDNLCIDAGGRIIRSVFLKNLQKPTNLTFQDPDYPGIANLLTTVKDSECLWGAYISCLEMLMSGVVAERVPTVLIHPDAQPLIEALLRDVFPKLESGKLYKHWPQMVNNLEHCGFMPASFTQALILLGRGVQMLRKPSEDYKLESLVPLRRLASKLARATSYNNFRGLYAYPTLRESVVTMLAKTMKTPLFASRKGTSNEFYTQTDILGHALMELADDGLIQILPKGSNIVSVIEGDMSLCVPKMLLRAAMAEKGVSLKDFATMSATLANLPEFIDERLVSNMICWRFDVQWWRSFTRQNGRNMLRVIGG